MNAEIATPAAPAADLPPAVRGRLPVEPVLAWLLPFLLTSYLALSGGGYDIVVRSELGILVWWLLLLGAIAGLLPRTRLRRVTWVPLAALAGFLLWTWLAASWSQSEERTLGEVARVATYLGVFVLGACALTRSGTRSLLNGLAAGVSLVCGLAVLSRLDPSLFPADTASRFYATDRLSYPFDYSDGVGEFAALGLPLLLYVAAGARSVLGRAVAAAGLPLVLLCLGMTVSRGGILAAVVGVIVFLALAPDRISRLPTLATTAAATTVLMLALLARPGVRNEFHGVAPAGQRHSMLVITIAVLLATAALHALWTVLLRRRPRPAWLRVSRRRAGMLGGGLLAAVVLAVVVAFATGGVHSLWQQFKQPNAPPGHGQYARLLSIAGSHRYQYWQAAVGAFKTAPLKGIGPGTFEFYWSQHNTLREFVRNAHSLWMETLAEAGVVGLALIVAFFAAVLIGGAARALRAAVAIRLELATAVAGVAAFCAAAAFDWVWQIGVVPMIAMLLAAVAVASPADAADAPVPASARPADAAETPVPTSARPADAAEAPVPARDGPPSARPANRWRRVFRPQLVLALAALPALWGIAVPLATTVAVRSSQAAARRGDFTQALNDAGSAQQLEPGAASPRLQRALVLEQLGDIAGAEQAIAAAQSREPTNWRLWLVASRIATEANHPQLALADYRRARALNPSSPLFTP